MSDLVSAPIAVKRTADLLGRLLPHLSHSQSLELSSELFGFPNWHVAQRSDQRVRRPISCSERSEAYEDPLEEHRLSVARRLFSFNDEDDSAENLLRHLGMGYMPSLAPLRKIADVGPGCIAWRALQYDYISHFAFPNDPFNWSGSAHPRGLNHVSIFPAGSQKWSQTVLADYLRDARMSTHGFRPPPAELRSWTEGFLPRMGPSTVTVHGSSITQSGTFVLLMLRDRKRLDALIPIECHLRASRDSGGILVTFDIQAPIVSTKASSSEHLVSCMYNAGIEEFPSISDTLNLLKASDPLCSNEIDVISTARNLLASRCVQALRAGLAE